VTSKVCLAPLDSAYPVRLRAMANPPASLTFQGGGIDAEATVAIVGSRRAHPDAERFAHRLANALARLGVVVVSGGAQGIDAAAHRGALDAEGRTWAVAGTGCDHCFPPSHAALFEAIGSGPGTMIWPFPRSSGVRPGAFLARNRVLVALSDAVVVVQAGVPSGALRAAACARKLNKPLWVVPAPPWSPEFVGSCRLLDEGAHALTSIERFIESLGLSRNASGSTGAISSRGGDEYAPRTSVGANAECDASSPRDGDLCCARSSHEIAILETVSSLALHVDDISERTGLGVSTVAPTLLTLALENVVVEGPAGFFRRRKS
jgi:DNA processing protein